MQRGDALTLTIERPAAGGRMIARHEGAIVFVANAIPGEVVEAVVEKVQRGTLWARTTAVIQPSPDRVDPGGDPQCGGCTFAHIAPGRQIALKQSIVADAMRRLGHVELTQPIVMAPSPGDGYRMRARVHVSGGRVGFFREGTHQACDVAQTRQLRAETLDTLTRLVAACERLAPGAIAGIIVSENREATERACHLELAGSAMAGRLAPLGPVDGLVGLSGARQDESRSRTIWGTPQVTDRLSPTGRPGEPQVELARHARAFFQGNRYLLEPLLQHVMAEVARGPVVDLYAGAGLFSVAAAAAGRGPVVAVEGDPIAANDLRRNAAPYGAGLDLRAQSVEDFMRTPRLPARPATAVVDPPRTGLSGPAIDGLIALGAPRIVYVSCDVATLARDTRGLCGAGYQLTRMCGFDLFPNTPHIETVSVFER